LLHHLKSFYQEIEFTAQDVGYHHGKTYFDGMMKGGSILPLMGGPQQLPLLQKVASMPKKRTDRPISGTYNFTDLAQMVLKVRSSYVPVTDDGNLMFEKEYVKNTYQHQ